MGFFNFFSKKEEIREAPQPQPQNTYQDALVQQSYCDAVQRQSDFLKMLMEKLKYDPISQSTVFACINIISNNMGKIPWELKEDGKVINNSFIDHLFDESNLTHFNFIKNMIKDVLINGNGFAYINRAENGKPVSLRYLRPDQVTIFYNDVTDRLLYQVPVLNKRKYIEPINMIHFIMNSRNGVEGRGIIDFAHNILDLSAYTDKAANDYFKNGMSVQGILTSPTNLPENRRNEIRKGWNATEGNIRILEGGLQYQTVQSSSKEAELTANRTQNAIEICRYFQVSPVLVGILDHIVYGSVEQAQMDLVQNTLSSYIEMVEQELNRKLLLPSEKNKYYIDLYEDALIKSDKQTFVNGLTSLVDKGCITANELRKELGFQTLDDPLANKLRLTYRDDNQEEEKNIDEEE